MIQVNRIYLIFNRLVTKKFLVDTSDIILYYIVRSTHFFRVLPTSGFPVFRHDRAA